MRHVTITGGALIGLLVCFACIIAALLLLIKLVYDLENERSIRQGQDRASFLANCRNREKEIAKINRVLGLPPSGVKCLSLPVFNK